MARENKSKRGFDLIDLTMEPGEVLGSALKIGRDALLYKGLELIDIEGDDFFSRFFGTLKRGLHEAFKSRAFARYGEDFPWIAYRDAFRRGSSEIEEYYTVSYKSIKKPDGSPLELPINIKWKSSGKVDTSQLVKEAKYIIRETRGDPKQILKYHQEKSMLYNKELPFHYNEIWSLTKADNRYVNGDLKGREQFRQFFKHFVYLDLIATQKLGKREKVYEDGEIVTYRYKRPPDALMWMFHEAGNIFYDLKDKLAYNLAGALGVRAAQLFTEAEVGDHVNQMKRFPGRKPLMHYT